jgi:hypothetical protein
MYQTVTDLVPYRNDASPYPVAKAVTVPTRLFPNRGTRLTLAIANTLLRASNGDRLGFLGAFTLEDLPRGAFLGFYCGDFYLEEDEDESPPPTGHYSILGSGFTIVPRPSKDGGVSPEMYPMGMLNEPPKKVDASVGLVEWTQLKQIDPSSPTSRVPVLCVAMHTTRRVRAGEELHFHYGKTYSRKHYPRGTKVGNPSHIAKRDAEVPADYMNKNGVPLPEDAYA